MDQIELNNQCEAGAVDKQDKPVVVCKDANAECNAGDAPKCLCKENFYENSEGKCGKFYDHSD